MKCIRQKLFAGERAQHDCHGIQRVGQEQHEFLDEGDLTPRDSKKGASQVKDLSTPHYG